jgi:hypothetical protein
MEEHGRSDGGQTKFQMNKNPIAGLGKFYVRNTSKIIHGLY